MSTITKETLNAICPYFTMFPLDFPRRILANYGRRGQWVMDPFCGRGTTSYAARLRGMNTIGIDSNPVAIAIAEAKLVTCTPEQVVEVAKAILEEVPIPVDVPTDEFWQWIYHPQVLNQLCRLREGLLINCVTNERKALRAIILGALHGHVLKTTVSYFSNQCQRTYSPKPDYAVGFWKQHQMAPPLVDVLAVIKKRAERFYTILPTDVDSRMIEGDSRSGIHFQLTLAGTRADWFITSPPYYGMKSYFPDQWLRLWFMGGEPRVNYDHTTQLQHTGITMFTNELHKVWANIRLIAQPHARLIIRFGGIPSVKSSPRELLRNSLNETGWRVTAIRSAGFSSDGQRQAYQQAKNRNPAVEEFDLWASVE